MSAFQIDIPVRSTGIILLGIALQFCWIQENNVSERNYIDKLNVRRSCISIICLTACAACYQPIALMFIPGFLLISLFNQRLSLTNLAKCLILCLISLIIYALLWQFLLSILTINLPTNPFYNVAITRMNISQRLIELLNHFIDFIILPKGSMPIFISIILTIFSASLIYILLPTKNLFKKITLTLFFLILFIGIIPTLIFLYKGTFNALRPQASLGMYFTPALLLGAGVEKVKIYGQMGKYFWVIIFFLIGVQSFQASSTITHKQVAYEKDIITGQAILSDLREVAPNPSSIKVNIMLEQINGRKTLYQPERAYYSVPRNIWEGISNCHVFDCQTGRVHDLLKIVTPPQIQLTTHHVRVDDPILKELKAPLENLPAWPHPNSIKVLSNDSLFLKIGAN